MKGRILKTGLAALAAAAALSARAATTPATTTPATAPAATPDAKAAIEAVHDWAVRSVDAAKLVSSKATSPKLKQLADQIQKDHQQTEQEATQLAQERGIQLAPSAQIVANADHQKSLQAVSAASGAEFDRIAVTALANERSSMVTRLKQLRDTTPGKDAKLKKWLDDVENRAEAESTLAFQARSEVNQARQGRTPPAK